MSRFLALWIRGRRRARAKHRSRPPKEHDGAEHQQNYTPDQVDIQSPAIARTAQGC